MGSFVPSYAREDKLIISFCNKQETLEVLMAYPDAQGDEVVMFRDSDLYLKKGIKSASWFVCQYGRKLGRAKVVKELS
ncbi:hypothetical protein KKF61_05875 [Patescibacteria group bacterium]|nr:hypothetical protein [Patescibacteria group bacterium]MBU0963924.1 hypothetical protein [Patescibacteria group bacterium]